MWFGSHWGHPYSEPSAGDEEGLLSFITTFISKIPAGTIFLKILTCIGLNELYYWVKDEWVDDTTFAPRGPVGQCNLWEHLYDTCGLDEYTE